jgi:hypothetical protein
MLLRQSHAGADWNAYGFRSLKRLLTEMESQGLVQTGNNSKGAFAVWPKEDTLVLESPSAPRTYNPLRKPFWVAFVVDQPRGRRFFHRVSGHIRMGVSDPPSPVDEWVEIHPISGETQTQWARNFLEASELQHRHDLYDALSDPEWFRRFPGLLREIDLRWSREWNKARSIAVSETIETWCATHSISPAVAFQSPAARPFATPPVVKPDCSGQMPAAKSRRDKILAALARTPTEFLLEIPIPGKYWADDDAPRPNAESGS